MSATHLSTSERVCGDHATCERNKRRAFRKPQVCLTCERSTATHYIEDGPVYILRCDECLVSNLGCPHAAPNVCPNCYDAITLDLHEVIEYHRKKAEPRPCIRCKYVPQIIHLASASQVPDDSDDDGRDGPGSGT